MNGRATIERQQMITAEIDVIGRGRPTGQGAVLALVVYLTLRRGFLGQDQNAALDPYAVAAISALVRLFTRHAVSKLAEVFDTIFGTPKEDGAAPNGA